MRALLAKIGIALAALGPPALVGVGFWPDVRSHPVLGALALAGYWLVLAILGFVRRVGAAVQDRWVDRAAAAVDDKLTALVAGHHGRYVKRLAASLRYVDMQGLATIGEYALELRDVYVDVALVPKAVHETANEPFLGSDGGPSERRLLRHVLAVPGVYAVIGGPGSGKTTMLRRTALHLCRGRRLPILVYLRDHVPAILDGRPLSEIVAGLPWLRGAIPAAWFERRLDGGRCLIMLDGLDEVADDSERRKVVAWVSQQTISYATCTFAITSRPYGYRENPLTGASVLQVRRFSGEQVATFLHGWYLAIERRATGETGPQVRVRAEEKAGELMGRLRAQPSLYDLAANPLLLTMIANVHRYKGALPGSRAQLYGEMCEVLLHRRRESKGLTAGTGLRGEQKTRVARALAVWMMIERMRDIPAWQAAEVIGPALERVSRSVRTDTFLVETAESGLLVERETGSYAFAHLTLQEYLAAVEIREAGRSDLLVDQVGDPWWRETTLLWAADADATAVVEACLNIGSIRALALAYECVEQARETSPAVRDRLDAALRITEDETRERRRLVTGIRVHRWLREVIQLGDASAITAALVPNEIYRLFTGDDPIRSLGQQAPALEPALGMWRREADAFVEWVNDLSGDGAAYRLPTEAELALPAAGLVADLGRQAPWTRDGSGYAYDVDADTVRNRMAFNSPALMAAILGLLGRSDGPLPAAMPGGGAELIARCHMMRVASPKTGTMGIGHVAELLLDVGGLMSRRILAAETIGQLRQITALVRRQDFGRVRQLTDDIDVAGMIERDLAPHAAGEAGRPWWRLAVLADAALVVCLLAQERRSSGQNLAAFMAYQKGLLQLSYSATPDDLARHAEAAAVLPVSPLFGPLVSELRLVTEKVDGRVVVADHEILSAVVLGALAAKAFLGLTDTDDLRFDGVVASAGAALIRARHPREVILLVRD
ncbi:NACHT domain-containing protein [Streptosporangiaceae bacterium NEAU-GS5]|nr:NACHT domain-containing protein [Streptosporangiaceae bacterium NEAU-GS5]